MSRLVCTTWVIRSAYAVACATQQPEPASPALTMRHVPTAAEWACRGWDGFQQACSTRVCVACPTKLSYAIMCPTSLHPPARLPDTIISTNEPTPSNRAGGTAAMLKHSPGPPFRVAAGLLLQVGERRSAPVRPMAGSALGRTRARRDRSHCASKPTGGRGRVAAISGPLWFSSAPCALAHRVGLIFSNIAWCRSGFDL